MFYDVATLILYDEIYVVGSSQAPRKEKEMCTPRGGLSCREGVRGGRDERGDLGSEEVGWMRDWGNYSVPVESGLYG